MYLPQLNAPHLKVKLMQYRDGVVGAETEIRELQLIATQILWSMNKSCRKVANNTVINLCWWVRPGKMSFNF